MATVKTSITNISEDNRGTVFDVVRSYVRAAEYGLPGYTNRQHIRFAFYDLRYLLGRGWALDEALAELSHKVWALEDHWEHSPANRPECIWQPPSWS